MRIALGVEYDGRRFCGWQSQPAVRTVQDTLEAAIAQLGGGPVRLHAAGRTDTGVHAAMQVVHFDTQAERPLSAWVRGVNRYLPSDVAVLWSCETDPAFHARFSASARHYRYLLLSRHVRPALTAGRVGWHHAPLDDGAMAVAMRCLLGEHDFSSFRSSQCQAHSPIRQLSRFELQREGDLRIFHLSANGFLHHMVRNLIGTLVHIGRGAVAAEFMAELLAARDRRIAPPTFMPDGLYFAGVDYPAHFAIASEPGFRHYLG